MPVPSKESKACERCGIDITQKRADARFCGKRCRENARNAIPGGTASKQREAYRDRKNSGARLRYHEVKELILPSRRVRYHANKDRYADARRAYRVEHAAGKAAYDRAYRAANRDVLAAKKSAWKKANRDAIVAKRRSYYAENTEKYVAWNNNRRARKLGHPHSVGVSERDWTRMLHRYGWRCTYCGCVPDVIHMDHVVPLNLGGRHAIGNVAPACPSCNSEKGDRLIVEWRRYRRRVGRTDLLAAA